MITINVTTYNDQPTPQPISAEFDEMGGAIGRGEGCTLVLPDPERYISRNHADIVHRDGAYVICDHGSATPVILNGNPVGRGHEAVLGDGDEIRIGGYAMRVSLVEKPASISEDMRRPAPAAESATDDLLSMFGGAPSEKPSPFADLIAPAPPASRAAPPAGSAGAIPADYDPFADLVRPQPPAAQPSPRLPEDASLGLGPAPSEESIDKLFGLGPEVSPEPLAPGRPLAGPEGRVAAAPRAQRDDVSELKGAFVPPAAKLDETWPRGVPQAQPVAEPVQRAPEKAKAPEPTAGAGAPSGMVLSWETPEVAEGKGEIKTVVVPSPPAQAPAQPAAAAPAAGVIPPAAAPARPAVAGAASRDELLRAFLVGAGVPDLDMQGELTPEMMRMIGQLLRESTQGTLDLLLARALIKREVRADLTMIGGQENNPLKFSPNVEVALSHLLAPRGHGFMPPLRAMKDAYDDLRSHQFGFMAGMRAALAGVLERFDPVELEKRLTQKTVIDSLLPMNRRAKLWDLFAGLYGEISKEAEEDFHALFGKAFLRAYEEQIEKLKRDDRNA